MLYLNSKGVIDVNYNEKKFGNKELEFAIFCIENVADKLNIDAPKVYSMLTEQTNILNEYIIKYKIKLDSTNIQISSKINNIDLLISKFNVLS